MYYVYGTANTHGYLDANINQVGNEESVVQFRSVKFNNYYVAKIKKNADTYMVELLCKAKTTCLSRIPNYRFLPIVSETAIVRSHPE